jgi:glycosyltransferase involved in cell wall biosynthesis
MKHPDKPAAHDRFRILVVTQYFHPENFRINDLVEGMVARGHEVTVLTGLPNYPSGRWHDGYGALRGPWRERLFGASVIRVPMVSRGDSAGWRLMLNYLSFAFTASTIGALRARGRYDAIFVFEPSPVTVGIPAAVCRAMTGAPVLFWVLDLWPESVVAASGLRARWALGPAEALTRWIYRRCDRVLAQSRAFFGPLERQGVGAGQLRYFPSWAESVYQPVDRETAARGNGASPPTPALPVLPVLPEGFNVLFAGNIGVAQDFPTILAAAERLRDRLDIQWVVAGDGRMRAWVQDEIERRGLGRTVHLLGPLPMQDMPNLFARVDALLVTLRDEPIFALTIPGKIQSYLACGRPVIAALNGEGAEVVRRAQAGIACSAEDPDALAAAVAQMAALPAAERDTIGARARACYLAEFDREQAFRQLERWMAELRKPG